MTTWPRPYFLLGGNEDETVNARNVKDDENDDDLGVFAFARKTAVLLVPMAIIAGLFGMWLRAELLVVRNDFSMSLSSHEKTDLATLVSRVEYDAAMKLQDERYQRIQNEIVVQSRMINRNTILLERISQKLGIQRPPD
jgi:hypothetical protein